MDTRTEKIARGQEQEMDYPVSIQGDYDYYEEETMEEEDEGYEVPMYGATLPLEQSPGSPMPFDENRTYFNFIIDREQLYQILKFIVVEKNLMSSFVFIRARDGIIEFSSYDGFSAKRCIYNLVSGVINDEAIFSIHSDTLRIIARRLEYGADKNVNVILHGNNLYINVDNSSHKFLVSFENNHYQGVFENFYQIDDYKIIPVDLEVFNQLTGMVVVSKQMGDIFLSSSVLVMKYNNKVVIVGGSSSFLVAAMTDKGAEQITEQDRHLIPLSLKKDYIDGSDIKMYYSAKSNITKIEMEKDNVKMLCYYSNKQITNIVDNIRNIIFESKYRELGSVLNSSLHVLKYYSSSGGKDVYMSTYRVMINKDESIIRLVYNNKAQNLEFVEKMTGVIQDSDEFSLSSTAIHNIYLISKNVSDDNNMTFMKSSVRDNLYAVSIKEKEVEYLGVFMSLMDV